MNAPDFSEVPAALRSEARWVGWRYVTREDGKVTKEPRWAATDRRASTTDRVTWSAFDVAVAGVTIGKHDGIGYVLGDGRAGVDLDEAIGPDGSIKAWAVDFLRHALDLGVYVERSVSGAGLHFIGRATLPGTGHNVRREGLAVEWYAEGRYFTVSGDVSDGLGGDPNADMQPLIDRLEREVLAIVPGVTVDAAEVALRLRGQELLTEASALDAARIAAAERDFLQRAGAEMLEAWERDECAGRSEERQRLITRIAKDVGGDPVLTAAVFARSPRFAVECRRGKMPRLLGHEVGKGVAFKRPGDDRPWAQPPEPDDSWPEPVDLWQKARPAPLDPAIMPGPIAALMRALHSSSGLDVTYVGWAALAACAAALSDDFRVELKEGTWYESARLWVVLLGPPSKKKTPVLQVVTAPLHGLVERAEQRFRRAMAEHDEALRAHKKAKSEEPPPEPPRRLRYVTDDVTPEALGEVLKDNPQGLLLKLGEAASFFGGDSYQSTGNTKDVQLKMELYDGGPKTVDRIRRGYVQVPNWSVTLLGATQPDNIRQHLARMPINGMAQRVCWISSGAEDSDNDGPMDRSVLNAWEALIGKLYGTLARGPEVVILSEEAHAVRRRVFAWLTERVRLVEAEQARLANHVGKWHGLWARLTLTLHGIECALRDVYPSSVAIDAATAERAEALIRTVLWPQTVGFYEAMDDGAAGASTLVPGDVLKVAEHVLAKVWTHVVPSMLPEHVKRFRYRDQRQKAEVMQALTDLGWVRPAALRVGPGRQAAGRWEVNAAVHDGRFAAKAGAIRAAMAEMAERRFGE